MEIAWRRIIAEELLNNRLHMKGSSATERLATLTKKTSIGPYERVRVN